MNFQFGSRKMLGLSGLGADAPNDDYQKKPDYIRIADGINACKDAIASAKANTNLNADQKKEKIAELNQKIDEFNVVRDFYDSVYDKKRPIQDVVVRAEALQEKINKMKKTNDKSTVFEFYTAKIDNLVKDARAKNRLAIDQAKKSDESKKDIIAIKSDSLNVNVDEPPLVAQPIVEEKPSLLKFIPIAIGIYTLFK